MRHLGRRLPARDCRSLRDGDLTLDCALGYPSEPGGVLRLCLTDRRNKSNAGKIAELFEPVLVNLGALGMRFRGFERVSTPDGPAAVAQEWLVEILPPEITPPPAATPASGMPAGAGSRSATAPSD